MSFFCVESILNIYCFKYWCTFIHSSTFTFLLKVIEKSDAISWRAVMLKNDHNEAKLIWKKRYLLEQQIRQISGIQFFMSCINGTTTNTKTSSNIARHGIAYFIVFKNSKANKTVLFSCLHDTGMGASVNRLSSNKNSLDKEYALMQGLKQVVEVTKIIFSYFERNHSRDSQPCQTCHMDFFCERKILTLNC